MHAVQSVPGQGLFVDLDVFDEIRIAGGDKTLWTDEANRDNLLFGEQSPLKPFFARFVRKDDKAAVFEMRRNGREIASTSVPINPTRGIPAALKQELQEAFENFRAMGNDSKATEEAARTASWCFGDAPGKGPHSSARLMRLRDFPLDPLQVGSCGSPQQSSVSPCLLAQ